MAHIKERRTSSGEKRYEVRYRLLDGRERSQSFKSSSHAKQFKTKVEAERYQGTLADPRVQRVLLRDFAAEMLRTNTRLTERSREEYESTLRKYVLPPLGDLPLRSITPMTVHRWHADLVTWAPPSKPPKAYARLRWLMNKAVRLRFIDQSPCVLEGAAVEARPDVQIASLEEIYALADAMPDRYRLLVRVAGLMGLRRGELLGLARDHVDLLHEVVNVERQQQQLKNGEIVLTPPKTGSARILPIPKVLLGEFETQLNEYATPGLDGRLFPGAKGGPTREGVLWQAFVKARVQVGVNVTLHGLRHSALTLAGRSGVPLAQIQAMAGHSTVRAAMLYQHADDTSARRLADFISEEVQRSRVAS